MYERILVGIDGSDASREALDEAVTLASHVGATVHIVMVVEPQPMTTMFGVDEVDALNQAVEEVVQDVLSEHTDTEVDLVGDVRRGRPARALLQYAHDHEIDAIVVGRSGSHDLGDAILGSTTDRLARSTDVPLHIIPKA